ncbi:MAG: very short patch repair endonuclease [Pyrinomonadaceae bacterium]
MSANRAKNTKPELLLRKALYNAGHRGYRINFRISDLQSPISNPKSQLPNPKSQITNPKSSVRPDITFTSKKLAIFVHGCYWHRCPKCNFPLPKNNSEFWQAKFTRNTARDARKTRDLRRLGWKVITVRECDLKNRFTARSSSQSDA